MQVSGVVYIVNHNYGRFIEKSIQSVLSQKFTDYHLIIIDDGSKDDSREIINRYRDNLKITIVFQENQGLNASNNIVIK